MKELGQTGAVLPMKIAAISLSSDCDGSDEEVSIIVPPRQNTTSHETPPGGSSIPDSTQEKGPIKRKKTAMFKKNPKAPKRFRSGYILFAKHRHKELRQKLSVDGVPMNVPTMFLSGSISNEWRSLDQVSKNKWNNLALKDKERYQREKASFTGPWKVRTCLRTPKDPNSPKRPVPAYFAFSNERRQGVRDNNPEAASTEISRILSDMWKNAPVEIRKCYLDREFIERRAYHESTKAWRAKREAKKTDIIAESQPVQVDQDIAADATLGSTRSAESPQMSDNLPLRMDSDLSIGDESSTNSSARVDTLRLGQAGTASSLGLLSLTSGLLPQRPFGSSIVSNPDQALLAKLLKSNPRATQVQLEMQNPDREALRQLLKTVSIQPVALGYSRSVHPTPSCPSFNTRHTRSRLMQAHVVGALELFTGAQPTVGGVPFGGDRNPRTLPAHASILMSSDDPMRHLYGIADLETSRRILAYEAAHESAHALLSQFLGRQRKHAFSTTGLFNLNTSTSLHHNSNLHSLLMRLGSSSSDTNSINTGN